MKSRVLRLAAAAFVSFGILSIGSFAPASAAAGICGGTFQPPCPPSEVCVYIGTFPECVSLEAST